MEFFQTGNMKDKQQLIKDSATMLTSPDGVPFNFNVLVRKKKAMKNSGVSFEITGEDPITHIRKTCLYYLKDREHNSYLDFFEKSAMDFGLRVPQNRQPSVKHSFKGVYRELLCENIVPEMVYGYGDPAVIRVEEGIIKKEIWYYLVSTSNDAPNSFPICRSRDLIDWNL